MSSFSSITRVVVIVPYESLGLMAKITPRVPQFEISLFRLVVEVILGCFE
jgi:hypothetical protein